MSGHREEAWADAERAAAETAVDSAERPQTDDEAEGAPSGDESAQPGDEEDAVGAEAPAIVPERDQTGAVDGGRRSTEGRLARLHLRVGLLALARAELETMAADGILDIEAMADLAEARWRSGDLVGAGEAAQAHLGGGGDETLAHVVAAEALAAQGRTGDARRHVSEVMERAATDVETLFSGQPRSRVWPQPSAGATAEGGAAPPQADSGPLRLPLPFEDAEPLASDDAPRLESRATHPEPSTVARGRSADAGDELAAIRSDLDAGRLAAVAAGLSLLVRSEPRLAAPIVGLAEEALERVDPNGLEAASLHLVRGDAYRLLGRELEAVAAFQGSRRSFARTDKAAEDDLRGDSPADAPSHEAASDDERSVQGRPDPEEST